jgi:hypothetical protein
MHEALSGAAVGSPRLQFPSQDEPNPETPEGGYFWPFPRVLFEIIHQVAA